MAWEELKSSGITSDTPSNILFNAGTIHKGLAMYTEDTYTLTTDTTFQNGVTYYTRSGTSPDYTYTAATVTVGAAVTADTYYIKHAEGTFNFEESLISATSGGTKLTITPEYTDIEVDGALVKVKGLTQKTGETAILETNIVEVNKDILKMLVVGQEGTSTLDGLDVIESKARLALSDYITNFGFVGHKTTGEPMIVIFDNALCTSGLEVEAKNKENAVLKGTFECAANISAEADRLPYHIYTPTPEV